MTPRSTRIGRRTARLCLGRQGRDGFRAAPLRRADDRFHDLLVAQAFLARRMRPARLPHAARHMVDLERELIARMYLWHLLDAPLAVAPEQVQALALVGEGVLDQQAAALAMQSQRLLLIGAIA